MADGTCSKPGCGKQLDTEGYPRWCRACRKSYKADYDAARSEMYESRGFAAGVTAMRYAVMEHFRRFLNAHFSAPEVSEMVRRLPGPGDVKADAGSVPAKSDR